MDSLEDFFAYDELTFPHLQQLGWAAELVSWRQKEANWDQYDAVVIRSTWDYQNDLEQYLTCLSTIERSSARLENPLDGSRMAACGQTLSE